MLIDLVRGGITFRDFTSLLACLENILSDPRVAVLR